MFRWPIYLKSVFLDFDTAVFLSSTNFSIRRPIQKKLQRKPIFITTSYIDDIYKIYKESS